MRWLISIPLLFFLVGCSDLGYYWHNANGHLSVMDKRVDIDELLAEDDLDSKLRERLLLVQEIRRFSIERLDLPANRSYLSYVELDRPYVVRNIVAAPEFSTRLVQWCYPIIGCASYRGYFDEERLLAYHDDLVSQGLDVYIGNVSAYSTLGWFDDPVLSSFINWPDYRLAGLLFHELTHQQIYIDDDTTFNESLATAVQQVGTELWLKSRNQFQQLEQLESWWHYRNEVITLIENTRQQLAEIYSDDVDDAAKRERKRRAFQAARAAHTGIASKYGITGGYTHWFSGELNNAKIGSVAAYHSLTPAFIGMIRAYNQDFTEFYRYVESLGKLDKPLREDCLQAWIELNGPDSEACPLLDTKSATAF